MFLAHAPLSFLSNEIIQKKRISKLTQAEQIFVGIFALLAGIAPDLDIFVLQGLNLPTFIHHDIISHTLIFYVGVWILLKLIVWLLYKALNKKALKFLNRELLNILFDTFLIGTIVHILADFLVGQIMILYPFSGQGYSVLEKLLEPNLFAGYFFSIAFGMEMVILGAFVIYMILRIFKQSVVTKVINIFVITVCTLFLGSSIYASFNTYNKSIFAETNNTFNCDADLDFVIDDTDMDVDNDGTDNLLDVDIQKLVEQVSQISSSSKWTAYGKSPLVANLKSTYGGFTSYRLISQAYFNLHSPITSVLWNQAVVDGDIDNYLDDLIGLKSLRSYFNSRNLLTKLTSEETVFSNGTLFFISNSDGEVQNVGIVLGNDSVGIVLPYDERIKTHTFSDVTNYYGSSVVVEFTK